MIKIFWEFLPFLISSLITFYLLYKNTPITTLQQINSVLLVILLGLFSMVGKISTINLLKKVYRIVLALLLSLFAQLLIFATGGFFSPFLIILHLLTIAFSFILNFGQSISFLLLSVVLLVASIVLNQNSGLLFRQDPFSVVLYGISFVVIIPLIQFISKTYHLNEVLYRNVSGNLKISTGREHSLLKGLKDIVIITDDKLRVVSLNESAAKTFNLSQEEYQKKSLLEVLILEDSNGKSVSSGDLSVDKILQDKTTRIIDNFFCKLPDQKESFRVKIQISPVLDESSNVVQLVFLISEAQNTDFNGIYMMSLMVSKKLDELYSEVKHLAYEQKPDLLNRKIELLQKMNEDILLLQEINAGSSTLAYTDAALALKNNMEFLKMLAHFLNVVMHFNIGSDKEAESAYESLMKTNSTLVAGMVSPYLLFSNGRELNILFKKLLEIGIFIASSKSAGQIYVLVDTVKTPLHSVVLTIQADSVLLTPEECTNLLVANYPGLGAKTNLGLASGLEGVIAKIVAQKLGSNIEISYNEYNSKLIMTVSISEKSPSQVHS
jgi:PAS domain-containing protein